MILLPLGTTPSHASSFDVDVWIVWESNSKLIKGIIGIGQISVSDGFSSDNS